MEYITVLLVGICACSTQMTLFAFSEARNVPGPIGKRWAWLTALGSVCLISLGYLGMGHFDGYEVYEGIAFALGVIIAGVAYFGARYHQIACVTRREMWLIKERYRQNRGV